MTLYQWSLMGATAVVTLWTFALVIRTGRAVDALWRKFPAEAEMRARSIVRHCCWSLPISVVILVAGFFADISLNRFVIVTAAQVVLLGSDLFLAWYGRRTYPYASGGPVRKAS